MKKKFLSIFLMMLMVLSTVTILPITVSATGGSEPTHDGVQLWENGPYFATTNLGADSPEKYGDYYAWGETEPYYSSLSPLSWKSGKDKGYVWDSYCGQGSFAEWSPTPYDTTSKILKPEFDAATAAWGDGWRTPTNEEIEKLLDSNFCTATWTDNYNNTGVPGTIFTGKTTGYTDKSIFLPANGYFSGSTQYNVKEYGAYWVSGMKNEESAKCLLSAKTARMSSSNKRYYGMAIRPVSDVDPCAAPAHTHGTGAEAITFEKAIATLDDLKDLFTNGGSGYLTADITTGEELIISKAVDLCLNDHVITGTSRGSSISLSSGSYSTLNLYDCGETVRYFTKDTAQNGRWVPAEAGVTTDYSVEGGCITHNGNDGFGVSLGKGGCTFNMYGGNIVGIAHRGPKAGGVEISEGSTFNMYGGNICGNINAMSGPGGVLVSASGTFNMYGGKIFDNFGRTGGVQASGTFIMTGGEITGNMGKGMGGGVQGGSDVILGGTAKITGNKQGATNPIENNLFTSIYSPITIGTKTQTDDGNGVDAPATGFNVGVTIEQKTGKFTTNGTAEDLAYFFSDSDKYKVCFNAGTETAGDEYLELKACAAKIGDVKYLTLAEAIEAVEDGETITLLADNAETITLSKVITFSIDAGGCTNSAVITADKNYELSTSEEEGVTTYKNESVPDAKAAAITAIEEFAGEDAEQDILDVVSEATQEIDGKTTLAEIEAAKENALNQISRLKLISTEISVSELKDKIDALEDLLGVDGDEIKGWIDDAIAAELAEGGSIESAIKTVSDALDDLTQSLTDLDGKVDALEALLGVDGDAVKGWIDDAIATELAEGGSIESAIKTVSGALDDLTQSLTELEGTVEGYKTELATEDARLAGLISANDEAIKAALGAAKAELNQLIASKVTELSAVDTANLETLTGMINDLTGTVNTKAEELNGLITANKEAIEDLKQKLSDLDTKTDGYKTELDTEDARLAGLISANDAAIKEALASAKAELNQLIASKVAELEGADTANLETLTGMINDLTGTVNTKVAELNDLITANKTAIEKVAADLAALDAKVAENKAALDAKDKEIEDNISTFVTVTIIVGVVFLISIAGLYVLVLKKKH